MLPLILLDGNQSMHDRPDIEGPGLGLGFRALVQGFKIQRVGSAGFRVQAFKSSSEKSGLQPLTSGFRSNSGRFVGFH